MEFGNLIRRLRRERNLTLKEVAEQIGISYSQLAKIERGIHNPGDENYKVLSDFFKIGEFIDEQTKDMRIPVNDPVNTFTRLETLIRDAFTCQLCGGKKPEKSIDVYHIIPIDKKGNSEKDNLVTLCNKCHAGRQVFIEKYGFAKDPLNFKAN